MKDDVTGHLARLLLTVVVTAMLLPIQKCIEGRFDPSWRLEDVRLEEDEARFRLATRLSPESGRVTIRLPRRVAPSGAISVTRGLDTDWSGCATAKGSVVEILFEPRADRKCGEPRWLNEKVDVAIPMAGAPIEARPRVHIASKQAMRPAELPLEDTGGWEGPWASLSSYVLPPVVVVGLVFWLQVLPARRGRREAARQSRRDELEAKLMTQRFFAPSNEVIRTGEDAIGYFYDFLLSLVRADNPEAIEYFDLLVDREKLVDEAYRSARDRGIERGLFQLPRRSDVDAVFDHVRGKYFEALDAREEDPRWTPASIRSTFREHFEAFAVNATLVELEKRT